MIQTYFGDGKGKTTASIGAAIRCAGCGKRVLIVQFLKNSESSEFNTLKKINGIDILCSDEHYELFDNANSDRAPVLYKAYNKLLFVDVKSKTNSYQMLVLDEVLDAVSYGYIDEDELIELISKLKDDLEVILTGHTLREKIAGISDYTSEVKSVKHPYKNGALPREGIEF